ncbi:hypothetical protein NL676_007653 [Syzygium grande]|nr:hypothetical protein NL676_007653 [Syzygium grande]
MTRRRTDERGRVKANWAQLWQELLRLVAQQLAIEDFRGTSRRSAAAAGEEHDLRKKDPSAHDACAHATPT